MHSGENIYLLSRRNRCFETASFLVAAVRTFSVELQPAPSVHVTSNDNIASWWNAWQCSGKHSRTTKSFKERPFNLVKAESALNQTSYKQLCRSYEKRKKKICFYSYMMTSTSISLLHFFRLEYLKQKGPETNTVYSVLTACAGRKSLLGMRARNHWRCFIALASRERRKWRRIWEEMLGPTNGEIERRGKNWGTYKAHRVHSVKRLPGSGEADEIRLLFFMEKYGAVETCLSPFFCQRKDH